jgi:calcineurin-like phosphoesterase family protein
MGIFITSDPHFHHKNILDFEERPFNSLPEMNEGLIESWNSVVKKTDTVYHLGDFSFGGVKEWEDVLNQLRGNIILIKGNHDKSKIAQRLFRDGLLSDYHPLGTVIKTEGMILNLSHYPMMIGARPRNFSIHGHLHSYDTGFTNHVNVGVDSTFAKSLGKPFGTPIEFEQLIKHLHEINPLVEAEKAKINEEENN